MIVNKANTNLKSRAFTLLELLVVIAIISLLIAIIIPGLRSAREQALSVYCRNNLKQMSLAAGVYTSDFGEHYPLAQYTDIPSAVVPFIPDPDLSADIPDQPQTDPPVSISYAWDFTVIQYSGLKKIIPGLLWQGETVLQVHKCPSYKGDDNWTGAEFSGYNYNTSFIGHGEGERINSAYKGTVIQHPVIPFTQIVMSARTCQIRNPASCVIFGDGQYAGGANKFMRSPWIWEGDMDISIRAASAQGFRHRQSTNVAWCDGHVTGTSEIFTESYPAIKSQLEDYNKRNKNSKIGFISSDNRLYDLK